MTDQMQNMVDIIEKRIEFLREKAKEGRHAPAGSALAISAGLYTERLLEATLILGTIYAEEIGNE